MNVTIKDLSHSKQIKTKTFCFCLKTVCNHNKKGKITSQRQSKIPLCGFHNLLNKTLRHGCPGLSKHNAATCVLYVADNKPGQDSVCVTSLQEKKN